MSLASIHTNIQIEEFWCEAQNTKILKKEWHESITIHIFLTGITTWMMCGKYENHVLLWCAIRMGHTWHLKAIGLRITISDGIELIYIYWKKLKTLRRHFFVLDKNIGQFFLVWNTESLPTYLYFLLRDRRWYGTG